MLAELRSWIAGLITLIFFATILEMLLPTSAMRRFVRLVISLVLITVLMKPVFTVMELTFAPERVLWNLQQSMVNDHVSTVSDGSRVDFDALVMATARDRVRQQVEQSALQTEGVMEATAKVTFDDGQGNDMIRLKEIEVSIVPGSRAAVPLVKPVEVRVQNHQPSAVPAKSDAEWSTKERSLAEQVQRNVASVFGVEPRLVRVLIAASY